MKAEVEAMALAGGGDARAALIIEAFHGVGGDIGLGVEIKNAMACRPGDAILQRNAAPQINTDPILEGHHRGRPVRGKQRQAPHPAGEGHGLRLAAGNGSPPCRRRAPTFRWRAAQLWPTLTAREWPADCRAAF